MWFQTVRLLCHGVEKNKMECVISVSRLHYIPLTFGKLQDFLFIVLYLYSVQYLYVLQDSKCYNDPCDNTSTAQISGN